MVKEKVNLVIEWIRQVLGVEDEVFYINGPQTLPPPLSKEEENELILKIGEDDEAKKILIERNLHLASTILMSPFINE